MSEQTPAERASLPPAAMVRMPQPLVQGAPPSSLPFVFGSAGEPQAGGRSMWEPVNHLSDTMSDLAIRELSRPPPCKIRRRNAITIQEADVIGCLPHALTYDSFENSVLTQRLEEIEQGLPGQHPPQRGAPPWTMNDNEAATCCFESGQEHDLSSCQPVKRKVPAARPKKLTDIASIALHHDLISHVPSPEVPVNILNRYTSNLCHAVVLYQSPVNLVTKLELEATTADEPPPSPDQMMTE